jgi:tRNA (mo5U34)-methyltransferase
MSREFFLKYYAGLDKIYGSQAFEQWRDNLPSLIDTALQPSRHGDILQWQQVLNKLPVWPADTSALDNNVIDFSSSIDTDKIESADLSRLLMQLKPWRKGPFRLHGVAIDSEWRSDLKWDRLKHHISPLEGKLVLDVGCGNGYHCWRMAGAGARAVLGIDPTYLYLMQYFAVQHFARHDKVFVMPFSLEMLPEKLAAFDTVFSMGVLYHQRSPIDHLLLLRDCLRPGGELVLETLIVDADKQRLLVPRNRYARMKNVWFIPDCDILELWLERCGFKDIRLIDISKTSINEQRATGWSAEVSLIDFLDPNDTDKTVEGYPAPIRAILIARN